LATVQEEYEAFQQTWRPTQEKVEEAVRLAVEIARPSRIFLFGSWPRGEAKVESDLDLAVFLDDQPLAIASELEDRLLAALDELSMSVDLVVATEETVAEFSTSVNSIFSLILREGKLVYERSDRRESADAAA